MSRKPSNFLPSESKRPSKLQNLNSPSFYPAYYGDRRPPFPVYRRPIPVPCYTNRRLTRKLSSTSLHQNKQNEFNVPRHRLTAGGQNDPSLPYPTITFKIITPPGDATLPRNMAANSTFDASRDQVYFSAPQNNHFPVASSEMGAACLQPVHRRPKFQNVTYCPDASNTLNSPENRSSAGFNTRSELASNNLAPTHLSSNNFPASSRTQFQSCFIDQVRGQGNFNPQTVGWQNFPQDCENLRKEAGRQSFPQDCENQRKEAGGQIVELPPNYPANAPLHSGIFENENANQSCPNPNRPPSNPPTTSNEPDEDFCVRPPRMNTPRQFTPGPPNIGSSFANEIALYNPAAQENRLMRLQQSQDLSAGSKLLRETLSKIKTPEDIEEACELIRRGVQEKSGGGCCGGGKKAGADGESPEKPKVCKAKSNLTEVLSVTMKGMDNIVQTLKKASGTSELVNLPSNADESNRILAKQLLGSQENIDELKRGLQNLLREMQKLLSNYV